MLFNSLHFLIFFPIVVIIYYLTKHKFRWIILLFSSYYFYMSWNPKYILLIIFSTLIDYFSAIKIDSTDSKKIKKIFLALSLMTNLGLLFIFKYFNFFSDSFTKLINSFSLQLDPITLKFLLPVGISFYTFQTLSYTIDVYRGKLKAEKHLGIFAVYVSFFPQLVAGPIERATNLLPQFNKRVDLTYNKFSKGIKLILFGFFKKVVVADFAANYVNQIYNNVNLYTGFPLIIATFAFALQIYCDFSGYSDIAIGTARILGIKLMTNFKAPYFAKSISEFWKRWHISLSSWFKDYLYIPLGGNRVSKLRWYSNIFIVFLVSGLWHGANWTFVIWGALHGIFLILDILTNSHIEKLNIFFSKLKINFLFKIVRVSITFTLVNLGWIFFRANTVSDAIYIISNLFKMINFSYLNSILIPTLSLFIILGLFVFIEHIFVYYKNFKNKISNIHFIYKMIFFTILINMIFILGVFTDAKFIYFQF